MEHLINGHEHTNKMKGEMQYVPFKKLNVKVSEIFGNMCANGGQTGFDAQMLGIIHKEAEHHKK